MSHVCVCLCVCCGWPMPQDTRKDQQPEKTPPSILHAGSSRETHFPCAPFCLGSQPPSFSQDKLPLPEVRSPLLPVRAI